MSKTMVFMACLAALKRTGIGHTGITSNATSALILATSEDEAMGKALRMAKDHFVEKDGYHTHQVTCSVVADEWIIESARILSQEKQR